MRVKQTARKSTTHTSSDPIRDRLSSILITKRERPGSKTLYGIGKGGKSIKLSKSPHSKAKKRSGVQVLKDIRRLQRTTDLQIPRAAFQRMVRQITDEIQDSKPDKAQQAPLKFQAAALEALQESTEAFLTQLFEHTNLLAHHAGRVTIMPKDMELTIRLRNN
ncbi:histone H3.3 type 2, partial [Fragariocoptes setiger]